VKKVLHIRNRIWIEAEKGTFLGNGRIQLLEKVAETGSINDAARSLKMSYRKAWSLLDSMNEQAPAPFIIKSAGGSGGGGTMVTEAGLQAIDKFNKLNEKCRQFLEMELSKIEF
jgi:molybdate transport system regulatory protein